MPEWYLIVTVMSIDLEQTGVEELVASSKMRLYMGPDSDTSEAQRGFKTSFVNFITKVASVEIASQLQWCKYNSMDARCCLPCYH